MLKKDLLHLCLLHMLTEGDQYGYDMIRRLHDAFPDMQESSVYAILRELWRNGFLEQYRGEASDGPVRKYYRLTPSGAEKHEGLLQKWRALKSALDRLNVE